MIHLFELGTKTKPTKSAPALAAFNASSTLLTPQIFTSGPLDVLPPGIGVLGRWIIGGDDGGEIGEPNNSPMNTVGFFDRIRLSPTRIPLTP
jgi:hypothetical protein